MRPDAWLDSLLGNRSMTRILRRLVRDPGRVWTERELAKALGLSPNSVNRATRALRDQGILDFRRVGRSHAIRLRADVAIAKRLQEVFHQESQGWNDFQDAIRRAVPPGTVCYLFGSVARGEASESSDVDLLVVAATKAQAEEAAASIRSAALQVMPAPLEIIALDRTEARKRRKGSLLRRIATEGTALSVTKLEEFL